LGSFSSEGLLCSLAVLVGYVVVAGSLAVKLPQIVRILKKESAEGISTTGHLMETVAYTIGFAYSVRNGYPFSSFGDVVACWMQNVIIAALIAKYRGWRWPRTAALAAPFAGFCWFLARGCSAEVLSALQASTLVIMVVGARIPQIWLNLRRGGSGELSLVTYALLLAGNLARVFTSVMLTGDAMLIAFYTAVTLCNAMILTQIVITWRREEADRLRRAEA